MKVFCVIPPVAWRTLFSFIIVLVLTGENVGKEAKGLPGGGSGKGRPNGVSSQVKARVKG